VAALAATGTACSDDSTGDGASATSQAGDGTTTTTNLLDAHEGPNQLGCVTRAPGEPLSRDEAIVRFTTEQVCPGYVTVVAGTPVTFVNEDDVPHTVTVQVMDATGTLGEVVLDEEIPPGEYLEQQYLEPGILAFTTEALPAFRGTVEVQDAEAPAA
jgi:plastocyanin